MAMAHNAPLQVLNHNQLGNYRFLGAEGRPFSNGAVADEGYDLVRCTFSRPIPLEAGLAAAVAHVTRAGRPVEAIAGLELRIPEPFTEAGFETFNRGYTSSLKRLGLQADGLLPATRTNAAPVTGRVTEPSVYAVTYSAAGHRPQPAFVLSGVPESAPGDPGAMLDSIMVVLSARMEELSVSWDNATAIQLYAIEDVQSEVADRVLARAGMAGVHGIHWFPSLPPRHGLRLELDVRSTGTEYVLTES
jgi:hypothetical protein